MFKDRLKERRESLKLSQAALAGQVCITQQMIAAYEKGIRSPSLSVLKAIALTLHCSADYLIGVSDDVRGAKK